MRLLTDILYTHYLSTDIKYSTYVMSDIVLLNNVQFHTVDDLASVQDLIEVSVQSLANDLAGASDYVTVTYSSSVVDYFTAADDIAIGVQSVQSDVYSVVDVCAVNATRTVPDSYTISDKASGSVTINISDFVSINEAVNFGQISEISVNNIVQPADSLSYAYTDASTVNTASANDVIELSLRPFGSAILASNLLGNIILGARL